MKKVIKGNIGAFARFYHRIRSTRWIWRLLNRKSRNFYHSMSRKISSEEQKIIDDLRQNGIAITHIDKLYSPEVFKGLEQYAQKRWNDADVRARYDKRNDALEGDKLKSKSFFLVDLWTGKHVLDLSHPYTKFSLSDPILNIVNGYMDMLVKFNDWRLQVTVPMPEGMRSYASQEWHRDPEDQQLVKVFLYINDVDEGSGPFIYLKKSHIFGKWRGLFPQKPPRGSAGNESKIPTDDKVICTGKKGTIIFCDTSGLHRGGHAKTGNRFMYTSVFMSPAAVWPALYKPSIPLDISTLSPQAQYAVTDLKIKEPKYFQY